MPAVMMRLSACNMVCFTWNSSRAAKSLKEAIIIAISDVRKSGIGAQVLRVDECDLVTPSKSQGGLAAAGNLSSNTYAANVDPVDFRLPSATYRPRGAVGMVCRQLLAGAEQLVAPEVGWNAEVVEAINNFLERERQRQRHPKLLEEIQQGLRVVTDN